MRLLRPHPIAFACLALLVPLRSTFADEAPAEVFTPPVLVEKVEATYPEEALDLHLSGTVVLEFDLDEQGVVGEIKVAASAGHGFDEAAVAALKKFVFRPARRGLNPVSSHVSYIYRFTFKAAAAAQPKLDDVVRLRGGVYLKGSRAPAEGRVIAVTKEPGARTKPQATYEASIDQKGHFELRGLPPGRYRVVVIGPRSRRYEVEEHLGARDALTVNYWLEPNEYGRYESTVRADFNREEIARQTLTTEELVKMPGTGGDALRAIENLPGVQRPPFNSGLIIVRGGKPTDSRVFLSGAEVPQLYHFGGFTSVIPSALLDRVDYFAGNFGVRYGRAIAGVVDTDLRDPKRDRLHAVLETNVFDTGATIEGPVGKGGFILAARRSYVDALIGAVVPADQLKFTQAPVYYDYQALFDYPLAGGKLRLLASGSDDQLRLVFGRPSDADPLISAFGMHTVYHKLQLRYLRNFGKLQLSLQNSIGYTGQDGQVGTSLHYNIWSVVDDLRLEGRLPIHRSLKILFGVDGVFALVHLGVKSPTPPREGQVPSPLSSSELVTVKDRLTVAELAGYLEATWKPTDRLSLTPGIRFDYYGELRKVSYNPRLAGRFHLAKYTWLKAGVGLYSQPPQPTDYTQGFGNPEVRPESAIHTELAVEQGLLPGLMLEVTGFYKYLYDLVAPTQNYLRRDGEITAERVASDGVGRIYGAELSLRQSLSKRLFGMVSYTFMRSERRDCQQCRWRLFDFDQTHVLVLALHVYLPKGFEAGVRFRYVSGYPYTPAYGGFYDADADVYAAAQGPVNTARLEAFHELDLRVDKTFLFRRWLLKVYLDVWNVYNHSNAEVNQASYDFTRSQPVTGLPIVPAFGVRGEF